LRDYIYITEATPVISIKGYLFYIIIYVFQCRNEAFPEVIGFILTPPNELIKMTLYP
jgi:hypothetical protein